MKKKKYVVSLFIVLACGIMLVLLGCNARTESKINWDEYLRKVWVADTWHGAEYSYQPRFYFTIDSIEGNCIHGMYGMGIEIFIPNDDRVVFSGILDGDTAVCDLYIDSDKVGTLELLFNDGKIEAEIVWEPSDELPKSYVFRPYNLNDIAHLYVDKELTRAENIDTWGEVNVVAGYLEINKPYPVIYLTNGHYDILYDFEAGYQTASRVYEIGIEDYNGDGLDDVKIVTYFPYEEDSIFIERFFYQTDKGVFLLEG